MFREKIKVLDCTIRDGGLMNNHNFEPKFVREVYKAISEAGIDYMEIGYKNSKKLFSEKDFGLWKFCDDVDIKKVIDGIESQTKISVKKAQCGFIVSLPILGFGLGEELLFCHGRNVGR